MTIDLRGFRPDSIYLLFCYGSMFNIQKIGHILKLVDLRLTPVFDVLPGCVEHHVDQVAHHLPRAQPSVAVTLTITKGAMTLYTIYPRQIIPENI